MTRALVVNHALSAVCGIHDLGRRVYHALQHSTLLEVAYTECATSAEYVDAVNTLEPDAVIVNHRDDLTPWAADLIQPPTLAVLHQYEEATADARASGLLGRFDWVLALDPLLVPGVERLVAVGRPIPEPVEQDRSLNTGPYQIGSFGFAFPHKGFGDVASEIAALDKPAVYRLHAPEAFFNGAGGAPIYTDAIVGDIQARIAGADVHVALTTDHRPTREVVAMLAANDVNALLYASGQPDAGLSSALDFLIAARRPMLLSEADMFRHAWYGDDEPIFGASHWPLNHLGDVLDDYDYRQLLADKLYAWHHGRLVADVEALLGRIL